MGFADAVGVVEQGVDHGEALGVGGGAGGELGEGAVVGFVPAQRRVHLLPPELRGLLVELDLADAAGVGEDGLPRGGEVVDQLVRGAPAVGVELGAVDEDGQEAVVGAAGHLGVLHLGPQFARADVADDGDVRGGGVQRFPVHHAQVLAVPRLAQDAAQGGSLPASPGHGDPVLGFHDPQALVGDAGVLVAVAVADHLDEALAGGQAGAGVAGDEVRHGGLEQAAHGVGGGALAADGGGADREGPDQGGVAVVADPQERPRADRGPAGRQEVHQDAHRVGLGGRVEVAHGLADPSAEHLRVRDRARPGGPVDTGGGVVHRVLPGLWSAVGGGGEVEFDGHQALSASWAVVVSGRSA